MSKRKITKPYPNQGEIIRAIALGLDSKGNNKDIDRYAREGDYDHSLKNRMIKDLIVKPLTYSINKDVASFISEYLDKVLPGYIELVKFVPMNGMTRSESMSVLSTQYFALKAADFIILYINKFGGPKPTELITTQGSCLNVAFDWIENSIPSWKWFYQNIDKTNKEQIRKWRKRIELPSLKTLCILSKWSDNAKPDKLKVPITQDDINMVKSIILLARAIEYFRKYDFGQQSIDSLIEYLQPASLKLEIDIGLAISKKQMEICTKYSPFAEKVMLLQLKLKRTEKKPPKLKDIIREEIDIARKIQHQHDPDDLTSYFLDWMEARWFLFSGDHKKALIFYNYAFKKSLYCAGENQERIIKECLVLAARYDKRAFLKQLKHQMIAFGLFLDTTDCDNPKLNNSRSRSKDHVVEDWEVEQWAANYNRIFPQLGFFERQSEAATKSNYKLGPLLIDGFDDIKADYRNPDRTIKVGKSWKKKIPQLIWFIQINKTDYVKKLLDLGADVNVFSESGDTPILMAIEQLNPLVCGVAMDETCFKLICQKKHYKSTINSKTVKLKKTPLMSAVETGNPIILQQLLKMGAKVDFRGTIDNQTALYYCLYRLNAIRSPSSLDQFLSNAITNPNLQVLDSIRRNTHALLGCDLNDQRASLMNQIADERYQKIFNAVKKDMIERCKNMSVKKMIEIGKILIASGADPNAEHKHIPNLSQYTPLMLAAEKDEIELFTKMLAHGGDPEKYYLWNNKKISCFEIAANFKANNVLAYLKKS